MRAQLPMTGTKLLTAAPEAESPILLRNTSNSNTRPLQFAREISCLEILFYHLW